MRHILFFVVCFVTAITGLVILPAPADAQCSTPYRARVYTPSYSYSVPSYRYVAPVVVEKKVVVEKVIVPVFQKYVAVIPIVEFPTYGAYYTPSYGYPGIGQQSAPQNPQSPPANGNGQSSELKQILDVVKSFDVRLRSLEDRVQPRPVPPTPKPADPFNPLPLPKTEPEPKREDVAIPDLKQVNAKKCAICHANGNEASGGKFVLSDGEGTIAPLNNNQLLSLSEHVYGGTMPKLNARAKQAGITALTDAEAGAWMREIARQRKINATRTEQ